jgi:hypothetical protein
MAFARHVPFKGVALDLCTSEPSLSALGGGLVAGCLVKTMFGFGLTTVALGCHVPSEGVVLGYIHASAACYRVSLPYRGGGPRYLCCLLVLPRHFITMVYWSCDYFGRCFAADIYVGFVTGGCLAAHTTLALADAFLPCCSVVRMLCRSLLQRMLGRCGCATPWSSPTDALPMWLCCSLVVSDGCFAITMALLGGCFATLHCGIVLLDNLVMSSPEYIQFCS